MLTRYSPPADVLWGSFVMHSFLPHRNECVTNEPQRTSAGRLYLVGQSGIVSTTGLAWPASSDKLILSILAYVSGINPSTVIGRYCYEMSLQLRHEMHTHNNI